MRSLECPAGTTGTEGVEHRDIGSPGKSVHGQTARIGERETIPAVAQTVADGTVQDDHRRRHGGIVHVEQRTRCHDDKTMRRNRHIRNHILAAVVSDAPAAQVQGSLGCVVQLEPFVIGVAARLHRVVLHFIDHDAVA